MRYAVSLWCWIANHPEPLWGCGKHGIVWRCPACGRERASVLKHLGPYGI